MKNRAVRLTLLLLFLAAAGVTGYFVHASETRIREETATARDFDTGAVDAARAAVELRAAQQAYVAAGQGDDFWIKKASAAAAQLTTSLAALRANATSLQAQSALETALAAMKDFEQMDARAREFTVAGQRLLASDLIFSDGLEMTAAIAGAVATARFAEAEENERFTADLRRSEYVALAGCGVFALVVIIMLLPTGRKRESVAAVPSFDAIETRRDAFPAMSEFNAVDGIDDRLDLALTLDQNKRAATPPEPAEAALPESINLPGIAAVCTDLARIVDTRSLPAILEKTAAVLDAPGIVLWVADPDGRELAPTVAHGYPAQVVTRLGLIARDAENVTAAAFRTGLVQTVKGDAESNGAIAAPLITPAGAVGVMAAEVRGEGEQQPEKLAAAAIVAAQLATLVGPPASRGHSREIAGA